MTTVKKTIVGTDKRNVKNVHEKIASSTYINVNLTANAELCLVVVW